MSELLYFNGIDASIGDYSTPPIPPEVLSHLIQSEKVDEYLLRELRYKYEQSTMRHYAIVEGIDPKKLDESGWGVIFAANEDPAVIEALQPLLKLRAEQAGDLYRVFAGREGYSPGETKNGWLARHGAGPGPVDPSRVPYYLLIVGSPKTIPFSFQTQLDVQYAVGRIGFDSVQEYAYYAQSVVQAERNRLALPRKLALFGVANPDDIATTLSFEQLVEPLVDSLRLNTASSQWEYELLLRENATKARLRDLLSGPNTPAFLFASAHGISYPSGDNMQELRQGALLCQDWPGPRQWGNPIPEEFYFSAGDLQPDANFWGMIGFFYASYSVGTSQSDDFVRSGSNAASLAAQEPFLASLPKKILTHPNGGALAVTGMVDRVRDFSSVSVKLSREVSVYESIIRRLIDGHPVGSAFEYLNQRYAELATDLSQVTEEISFGYRADPLKLAEMWTANNDARNFIIIGDPAVRLMVAEPGEPVTDRVLELNGSAGFVVSDRDLMPEGAEYIMPDSLEIATKSNSSPRFITLLHSKNQEEALRGAEEAVEVYKKNAEISERSLDPNAKLDIGEQEIVGFAKIIENTEIPRQVQALHKGNRKERETALLVLEKFGPIARLKAAKGLNDLILNGGDQGICQLAVRVLVAVDNDEDSLTKALQEILKSPILIASVRLEALEGVKTLKQRHEKLKPELVKDIWEVSGDELLGAKAVEVLFQIYDNKLAFLTDIIDAIGRGKLENEAARYNMGRLLLSDIQVLASAWIELEDRDLTETHERIFQLLLATISLGSGDERSIAISWLVERVGEIPGELLDRMIKDLKGLVHKGENWPELGQLEGLIRSLLRRKRAERNLLIEELRSNDSATQIEAIKRSAESEDEWALRILIQEWVQWIAFGQSEKAQLVEEVAEKARNNALAVLPLVNQISQEFQPTREDLSRAAAVDPLAEQPKNKSAVAGQVVSEPATDSNGADAQAGPAPRSTEVEGQSKLNLVYIKQIEAVLDGVNAKEWNIQRKILKRMLDTAHIKEMSEDDRRKFILTAVSEEFKACELKVHRRVARQLADMSNFYYFKGSDSDESYKAIKASMEKYAVPILARILPEAEDDEIRKDLAFALGNIGGREAVDALARAVVGEERTRSNRQKLLAQYYLDPSKQRSDEAAVMLQEAVKDAKRTLIMQQIMNILIFVAGMVILIVGLILAQQGQDTATRVAGILAGIGGFGGVIWQLINHPIDRIQNAMANLVQLETAFTSFIWELNLNGTYIQSQYVAEGILDGDDIGQTIQRIEDAMNLTLDQVAAYTDRGRQIPVPQLIRVTPVVGKMGTTIQLYGRNLRRTNSPNGDNRPHIAVAINHVPVVTGELGKKKDVVNYHLLAEHISNDGNGPVWISLVIDGQETNALPFQLIRGPVA